MLIYYPGMCTIFRCIDMAVCVCVNIYPGMCTIFRRIDMAVCVCVNILPWYVYYI